MTVQKYTEEQEKELYNKYSQATDDEQRDAVIEAFGLKHNKTKRSIIAKLSKAGIYISKIKVSKVTGAMPETKKQLVAKIEKKLGIENLEGLDKAPKLTLLKLLK